MPKFLYKAKNNQGQIVTGQVAAGSNIEAEKILSNHGFAVMDLSAEKAAPTFSFSFMKKKVSAKDKAVFARQLSTMISSGLELPRAIKVTASQAKNEYVRDIYLDIYKDLEEGNSFSGALAKHSEAFDQIFVSVVNAGESTGKLDVVLKQLADQLENDNNFSAKIRGAMYYPGFILFALIGVGAYMMVKVVPQLKSIFDSAGASLPIATRILLALSDFLVNMWWLVLIIVIGVAIFLKYWLNSGSGVKMKDNFQVKFPLTKKLYEGIYMYRFTKVMSMLIGAGVPLLDALKIGGSTLNNGVYEASVVRIIDQVGKGVPLNIQLSKDPVFPPLIGQMAAVGEETGKLDAVFGNVAKYYEETTDQMIRTVSSLVEPVILMVMGLGVAFLVFAILVPIYNVAQLQ